METQKKLRSHTIYVPAFFFSSIFPNSRTSLHSIIYRTCYFKLKKSRPSQHTAFHTLWFSKTKFPVVFLLDSNLLFVNFPVVFLVVENCLVHCSPGFTKKAHCLKYTYHTRSQYVEQRRSKHFLFAFVNLSFSICG